MRGAMLGLGGWLAACKGEGKDKGPTTETDPTTPYTFDCDVTEPNDLADPFEAIVGHEHDCEQAANYIPSVPTATSYFVGEYSYDECGSIRGRETWVLYANPRWLELGGKDCRVVWDVDGVVGEGGAGDLSLNITAVVDPSDTDCDDIEDFEFEPSFNVSYDVARIGREATFFFEVSGDEVGRGEANDSHANFTSTENCKLF